MKIIITGASGFTGQHACQHFSDARYEVTAITRKSEVEAKNCDVKYCDLTNQKAVSELIKETKPDYVLHLAGQNHVGDSWEDPVSSIQANMMTTIYLLDAVRKECPSCKVVIVGSALQFDVGNIATLTHPYSLSKTMQVFIAQSWSHLYGLNVVIAKPSNIVGPGRSNGVCSIFARKIMNMEQDETAQKHLEVSHLGVQRDFVDVRDVVKGYDVLFQHGKTGEIYDIASGINHSLGDVIMHLKTFTDVHFNVKSKQYGEINNPSPVNPEKISKLGWKPTIPFSASMKDTLDYYRNLS